MSSDVLLPDTSLWVEYLRRGERGRAAELSGLLRDRRVITCGPVVAEVLAGTRPADQETLGKLLGGLPWAALDRSGWRRAGLVAGQLRHAGQTVALTDITIAVCAQQADAIVWSADCDFERIQPVLDGLRLRRLD